MSHDDGGFPNFLSHLERKFDEAALAVRESLSTATWLPPSARPTPPPPPPSAIRILPRPSGRNSGNVLWRSYAWSRDWVQLHAAGMAAVVAFVGVGGMLLYRRKRDYVRKRRARRGPYGMRVEVVVIACAPNSPIARSIILDLERRGFIVYVVVSSAREDDMVKAERKPESIIPLRVNVTDPFDMQVTLEDFARLFTTPHADDQFQTPTASTTTTSSRHIQQTQPRPPLHLAGVIIVPDLHYPNPEPLETTSLDLWSDTINTRILLTAATVQAFIPFLHNVAALNPSSTAYPAPRLLLLNSTATPRSLSSPFKTLHTTTSAALSAFTFSLRKELASAAGPTISVTEIRIGSLDAPSTHQHHNATHKTTGRVYTNPHSSSTTSSSYNEQQLTLTRPNISPMNYWSPAARERYSHLFLDTPSTRTFFRRWLYPGMLGLRCILGFMFRGKGEERSHWREMHNVVFDVLSLGYGHITPREWFEEREATGLFVRRRWRIERARPGAVYAVGIFG